MRHPTPDCRNAPHSALTGRVRGVFCVSAQRIVCLRQGILDVVAVAALVPFRVVQRLVAYTALMLLVGHEIRIDAFRVEDLLRVELTVWHSWI